MPPKRPALASQAIALNSNSSHEDVLTFLSSVLTVAQFSKVSTRSRRLTREHEQSRLIFFRFQIWAHF
jgi:hypothetical protein